MPSLLIRTANRSDATEIANIEQKLQGKHAWSVTQIQQAYTDHHMILVAEQSNVSELMGYAICQYVLDEAELHIIGTNPNYQRLGVASALLKKLTLSLTDMTVSKLFLEVRESNEAALGLYKKFGFIDVGTRKNYYQTSTGREDAVLLCLSLTHIEC